MKSIIEAAILVLSGLSVLKAKVFGCCGWITVGFSGIFFYSSSVYCMALPIFASFPKPKEAMGWFWMLEVLNGWIVDLYIIR